MPTYDSQLNQDYVKSHFGSISFFLFFDAFRVTNVTINLRYDQLNSYQVLLHDILKLHKAHKAMFTKS